MNRRTLFGNIFAGAAALVAGGSATASDAPTPKFLAPSPKRNHLQSFVDNAVFSEDDAILTAKNILERQLRDNAEEDFKILERRRAAIMRIKSASQAWKDHQCAKLQSEENTMYSLMNKAISKIWGRE